MPVATPLRVKTFPHATSAAAIRAGPLNVNSGRNAQTPAIRQRLGERVKPPLLPFKIGPANWREAKESGLWHRPRLREGRGPPASLARQTTWDL